MGGIDAPALLAFAAGIVSTVAAFAAKYFLDYRLTKRQLELDERSSIAGVLGARPGQLRRSARRLESRIASFDRDARQLGAWLTPGKEANGDGYYLTSSVQRVFVYATFAALLQQAMDALPHETMRARRDLQDQYVLLDLAAEAMTNIDMLEDFSDYPKGRASFQLFTGTLDEVADLGVGMYNRNSQVVPSSDFVAAYHAGERCLLQVRDWLSAARRGDTRGAVITARMFAVGAILRCYLRSDPPSFTHDLELARQLTTLSEAVAATRYDFAARIPQWLDAQGGLARKRWTT